MTTTIKKQILINARALFVGPENWIRGRAHNRANTAWCLVGVMEEAGERLGLGDDELDPVGEAITTVGDVIRRRCGPGATIPTYNDAPETTFNDIQELLDDAIDLCDA